MIISKRRKRWPKTVRAQRKIRHVVVACPTGIVLGVWPERLGPEQERRIENLLSSALGRPPE